MDIKSLDKKSEKIFKEMSAYGIRVDRSVFADLEVRLEARMEFLMDTLDLKKASSTEYVKLLEAEGHVLPITSKGNKRTGADVLKYLPQTETVQNIMELASVKSLWSLARSLAKKTENTDILHPDYKFDLRLGRVHSGGVNYLNWNTDFKKAIKPRVGYKLVSADQSQFELRVLRVLSGDVNLGRALDGPEDTHKLMASFFMGISPEQVTDLERTTSKEMTFGLNYGQTSSGLARKLECSREHAQNLLESYFQKFNSVKKFIDDTHEFAAKNHYVETFFGRRRDLSDLLKKDFQKAMRLAVSHRVQSTAGDLMRMSILKLDEICSSMGAKLIGQIHDSFIIEVPENFTDEQILSIFDKSLKFPELPFKLEYAWKMGV